jgi:phosphatidate phosphatase PAH1
MVEGVEDTGGWIYFKIPAEKQLGVGVHRIHMVMRGDLTSAEQIIDVAPPDAPVFVTDIDGRFPAPSYAFGNTASDAEAYETANAGPINHRIFYQFDDVAFGGRRIESYTELLEEFKALPSVCK